MDELSLQNKNVLVTGASGLLGRRVVAALATSGCRVRALVRHTSCSDMLGVPGVELVYGDLADIKSLRPAFNEIDVVVHAGAATGGSVENALRATVEGTGHVLELCRIRRVARLVYISSCAVYGTSGCKAGQSLAEDAPLEPFPERRGVYSWSKCEAERLVRDFMTQGAVPTVCLRPGMFYGTPDRVFTPMLGFSLGDRVFAVIRRSGFVLPLVHVDNLVEAIRLALISGRANGQIYNVVDPVAVTKDRYVHELLRRRYPKAWCWPVPYTLIYAATLVQERLCGMFGIPPKLTCYRLAASQAPVLYDSSKITRELGWRSRYGFEDAVSQIFTHRNEDVPSMGRRETLLAGSNLPDRKT